MSDLIAHNYYPGLVCILRTLPELRDGMCAVAEARTKA